MIVEIFIPCYIDQFYPRVAESMVRVLEKLGCGVNYNVEQTCCGQPAFNAGLFDECKTVGEKFIKEFSSDRYVVVPSASCVGMVKNYYPELFTNSILHNQYNRLRKNIFEFTDFLVNVLKVTDVGATFTGTATYHDSCSALRELRLKTEPRLLLSKVRGLELKEMKHTEECCGFGGTFSIKNPAIAAGMAADKIANAEDTGAEYIITSDSSCILHLQGYANRQKKNIKFVHIAEVLASGLE
jgi:L-lactate dehydrogenase complex protein LldE